jgi:type IV pilus assembly protein PilA
MKIRSLKKQLGQGMTEYIIIVALIAVSAIAVFQLFGSTVRNQTAAIAQEVAGGDGTANKDSAGTAATNAGTNAQQAHTLSSYTGNAAAGQKQNLDPHEIGRQLRIRKAIACSHFRHQGGMDSYPEGGNNKARRLYTAFSCC